MTNSPWTSEPSSAEEKAALEEVAKQPMAAKTNDQIWEELKVKAKKAGVDPYQLLLEHMRQQRRLREASQ